MTNVDSILKNRDIILLTKVHLVKAMFVPVVIYGCESWTIKNVLSELWNWVMDRESWHVEVHGVTKSQT